MWFRNGILSDKQFMKHYGKDIFLYPFDNYNLKGASYNLTASRVAYYKDEEGNFVSALVKKDKLILPAKKIIFIQTEEVIYVNQRICGTYHTKVKWVSLGLSSISTTLDPCYFGTSLVAVKNLSEDDIEMDVGETFCTVIFHKISSGNKDVHDNVPFRKDVSSGKIYKFENMIEYKKIERKHQLERLEELKKNPCYFDEEKQKLKRKEDIENDKLRINVYKELQLREEEREAEIKYKNLEYKNFLEEWYEQDFRRSKEVLIKKVKGEVRKNTNEKVEKIISVVLIVVYVATISFLVFGNKENILQIFLISDSSSQGTADKREFEMMIAIVTVILGIITFIHSRLINFFKEVYYYFNTAIYKLKDIL